MFRPAVVHARVVHVVEAGIEHQLLARGLVHVQLGAAVDPRVTGQEAVSQLLESFLVLHRTLRIVVCHARVVGIHGAGQSLVELSCGHDVLQSRA